ncbi:EF-hand domain-containing protein [Luteimonas composti]|uniref:EF-hand domain-containing protein n=1 Tax=Luteimonas composti TaxID=398257 RepID=A0ABT6MTP7_9GAMM|nr:EF-hand domain-containing protein [Luteimonas composti]MDH7453975.1 EF-hand domain-containing protein [Luteimonas composti]
MKNARKPLSALIAFGAALAIPAAFAQDPTTQTPPTDPTTTTAPTPTTPTPTAPTAEQKPLTWADLDVDGNGTLSQTEAATLPALSQVFSQADADGNGELTPDEYKTFAAANSGPQPASGGND